MGNDIFKECPSSVDDNGSRNYNAAQHVDVTGTEGLLHKYMFYVGKSNFYVFWFEAFHIEFLQL